MALCCYPPLVRLFVFIVFHSWLKVTVIETQTSRFPDFVPSAATAVEVAKMQGVAEAVAVAQLQAKGKMAKARMAMDLNVSVKDVFSKVFLDRFS